MKKIIFVAGITPFIILSCNMNQLMQINKDTREALLRNCDCADIRGEIMSTNGNSVMTMNLTGCEISDYKSEGERLTKILQDSVANICTLDQVNLVFIDKGIKESTYFQGCD
jgi:hypothetical protein